MNWLQKLSQSKPMSLPIPPPVDINREHYPGVDRIDEVMSEETAQREYIPGMQWGDPGARGVTYKLPDGKRVKHSRDRVEYENAQKAYEQGMDWVVPILEEPQPIQFDRPMFRILMKELEELNLAEKLLVRYLANRLERLRDGFIDEMVSLQEIQEVYVPQLGADMVKYLYERMKYIFQQNANTLRLRDLHAGNFGWDGNELKVWDLGPDRSS